MKPFILITAIFALASCGPKEGNLPIKSSTEYTGLNFKIDADIALEYRWLIKYFDGKGGWYLNCNTPFSKANDELKYEENVPKPCKNLFPISGQGKKLLVVPKNTVKKPITVEYCLEVKPLGGEEVLGSGCESISSAKGSEIKVGV